MLELQVLHKNKRSEQHRYISAPIYIHRYISVGFDNQLNPPYEIHCEDEIKLTHSMIKDSRTGHQKPFSFPAVETRTYQWLFSCCMEKMTSVLLYGSSFWLHNKDERMRAVSDQAFLMASSRAEATSHCLVQVT